MKVRESTGKQVFLFLYKYNFFSHQSVRNEIMDQQLYCTVDSYFTVISHRQHKLCNMVG